MQITVRAKTVYGERLLYPECDKAKLFAQLSGKKTLTKHALDLVHALGYNIQVLGEFESFTVPAAPPRIINGAYASGKAARAVETTIGLQKSL